jgi:hypothetical protein
VESVLTRFVGISLDGSPRGPSTSPHIQTPSTPSPMLPMPGSSPSLSSSHHHHNVTAATAVGVPSPRDVLSPNHNFISLPISNLVHAHAAARAAHGHNHVGSQNHHMSSHHAPNPSHHHHMTIPNGLQSVFSPGSASSLSPFSPIDTSVDAVDGVVPSLSRNPSSIIISPATGGASVPMPSSALSMFLSTPAPTTAFAYPPTADHRRARSERWSAAVASRAATRSSPLPMTISVSPTPTINGNIVDADTKDEVPIDESNDGTSSKRSSISSSARRSSGKRQRERVIRTKIEPVDDGDGSVVMIPDAADETLVPPKSSARFQAPTVARGEWEKATSVASASTSGDDGDSTGAAGPSPVDEQDDDDSSSDHTPAVSPMAKNHRRIGSKGAASKVIARYSIFNQLFHNSFPLSGFL